MTPLDFMLASMGDVTLPPQEGLDAAKAAAPYIRPKAPEKRIIAGDPDNAVPITAIRPIIVDPVARIVDPNDDGIALRSPVGRDPHPGPARA